MLITKRASCTALIEGSGSSLSLAADACRGMDMELVGDSQEMLANIAGTTRSRISVFMNRFRELGVIEYHSEMKVHSSRLSVMLKD
jgi:hypothetical protein